MYYITYQHHLKSEKTSEDFKDWLTQAWKIQRHWGAQFVKCWLHPSNKQIMNCRYAVNSLKDWNQNLSYSCSVAIMHQLSDIVDLNRVSITISPYREHVLTSIDLG